ncbi:hypothetical protein HAX54_014338 [Datura stramonium]|uniref:Uncharacterized protein n=1 Tax=Datura stramonium TaxID=4076 RepID=A0ABS8RYP7_DATST|nr:hypothetical protein [Datura stramonium]
MGQARGISQLALDPSSRKKTSKFRQANEREHPFLTPTSPSMDDNPRTFPMVVIVEDEKVKTDIEMQLDLRNFVLLVFEDILRPLEDCEAARPSLVETNCVLWVE